MTILVTGATGTVGSALVGLLAAKEQKVRAAVHSKDKAQAFATLGVPMVKIDFNNPKSFKPALEGVDSLFLIMTAGPRLAQNTAEIMKIVRASKVRRIVKLSAIGDEDTPLIDAHRQAQRAVERSGISYTILRPSVFMQNFINFMGDTIRSQGKIYMPASDGRIAFIDVRDIVDAAAAVLTTPNHDNKTYELTGPEALTYAQAAEILGEAIGREIAYVPVSDEQARDGMQKSGMSEWMVDGMIGLSRQMREGRFEKTTDAVRELAHHEPRSLSEFAADHAEALMGVAFTAEPRRERAEEKG